MPKVTAEIARFAVPAGKSLPSTNPSSAFVWEGSLPSKRLFCVTTASVIGWHSELRSTRPPMTCDLTRDALAPLRIGSQQASSRYVLENMERETGLESAYCNYCSSLLATNCFFSARHGGEFHFSPCLFLQNLGKSRKRVVK